MLLATLLSACGGGDGGNSPPATDTTPPSTPTGLVGTATSATEVHLQWTAASDDASGVAGYRVYRDGASEPIATVAGTSFDDAHLEPETQYSYTVRAFDGAQPANVSGASSPVTVTTPAGDPDDLVLTTSRLFPDLPEFDAAVLALQAPGDASTWYVVEQAGRVRAFANEAGVSAARTFVDVSSRVTTATEAGLLGMAFHPGYPSNPRVYLSYTTTIGGDLFSRISEFRTTDGGATLAADTERVLLTVAQPATNHNGGHVAFGPDGLFYIGFGDGGGGGDPSEPIGNGQKLTTLLGKMLRIDVDGTTGAAPYGIPPGNPHATSAPCDDGEGTEPCPEIYAYGFRNPWRWSFDRATGELWVGDVGQAEREEVDRVVVDGNYGWRCFEGTLSFNPDCGPNADVALPPIVEYDHDAGRAITGGYVYRGSALPALRGEYVFGDFVSGRLWRIPHTATPTRVVAAPQGVATGLAIASFAEDVGGELYVVDYGGALHRVEAESTP
ncbi:MAG TPA: PQQ-dependent sugar dehydrogenase [Steroidobacteraceae bacterium]